jgi:sulfite reductase (NADPH) flavoprotein alpha-component
LQWLKEGAYFYVCGDESKMAKDVDAALREIAGDELVEKLKQEGRYLRDVY